MEFKKATLENGLVVAGEVNRSAKSAAVGFFVRAGSRDESAEINGVSHFLEHMLFKGTDRLSAQAVNEAFDRRGAQFNAFTSEENTVFYAAVLPEYLVEVTELWGALMRPALRDEDFAIEKNVIKEEIAMYKDLPSFDVMERCRGLYFGGHPCGNSVLGSEESIDGLTAGQMRDYFGRRYAPNNMVLACAGDFEWEQIVRVAEERCGKWRAWDAGREVGQVGGSGKKERREKGNLVREHVCLMSPGVAAQDERRYAASLLASIVGDEVGSRYFWGLVDKAMAESATMQFGAMDGTGAFVSYISCSSENVARVMDIVGRIFEDLASRGVREEELRKAKNKVVSALVIKNELPMGRLVDLGFNWVYLGRYRTVEEDISAVRAVTVEDIGSVIEQFDLRGFTEYILGPSRGS
ncbi:MAG: insulinase family protein [Phycisphaerales bacterium]|nr:MAG: insulinase family protein [Phycisphaerales bacterium]